MKNFIFKSSAEGFGLVKKFINKLDMILAELRHNRQDMVMVLHLLNKFVTNQNLQKQVDEYFDENEETPPQTDQAQRDLD